MRYMLDTNLCIDLIQRRPPALIARLEALRHGEVGLSAIVLAELRHGVERDPTKKAQAERALRALLQFFPVASFDDNAACAYGVLRAGLPDRRRDAFDRLIAAHAIAVNAVLVTNNEADFRDYPGLTIENWLAAPFQ